MYISPKISIEEVKTILTQKKSLFPIKIRPRSIYPKRIELIYVPFYLFEAILEGNGVERRSLISVDGLVGEPSFYTSEDLQATDKMEVPTCDVSISKEDAMKISTDFCKGLVLEQGLKFRKYSVVKQVRYLKQIFYPFWIGYFQKGKHYDFKAVDAVTGEIQRIKMRQLFLNALRLMQK